MKTKASDISYSTAKVLGNIKKFYKGFEVQAREYAEEYAAYALAMFVADQLDAGLQGRGLYWTNRTGVAAGNFYTRAYSIGDNIGYFARHGNATWYASALEDWVESKKGYTSVQDVIRKTAPAYFNKIAEYITGQSGMFDYMYGEYGVDMGGSFGH